MKQVLIMMLGHPGSGKSYFAKNLAKEIGAVRLNADSMRSWIFNDIDGGKTPKLKLVIFGGIDYALHEVLKAGHSAIYDAQHNHVADREKSRKIAKEFDVPAILVWIKTPYDVSAKRGQNRQHSVDQKKFTEQGVKASIEKHINNLEEPLANEICITIDGTKPFKSQYQDYRQQLRTLIGR